VWGEGIRCCKERRRRRIIPTRVGRRRSSAAPSANRPDHPHACGEKCHDCAKGRRIRGSSPRVWGEVQRRASHLPAARIIPTRVGRSSLARAGQAASADHPHACGEKNTSATGNRIRSGSSPRVWGEAGYRRGLKPPCRIIPTRVGRRAKKLRDQVGASDHPHACGEKPIIVVRFISSSGSSPRVWGEVEDLIESGTIDRIIPTRVGRSRRRRSKRRMKPDHPHACGEKFANRH